MTDVPVIVGLGVVIGGTVLLCLVTLSEFLLRRRRDERNRDTRFVHWASTHERQPSEGVEVCGCLHCEQMRRDLGLQESWRWRKWTIPSRYV